MKKYNLQSRKFAGLALAMTLALAGGPGLAYADERGDLEQLRATTLSLIEALVETGAITRERADKLIGDAEQKARARAAQTPPPAVSQTSVNGSP